MAARSSSKRIHFLDEMRGFAILCMVFYHAFYLMANIFSLDVGRALFSFFMPAEPYFAGLFILISGISAMLTRSNLKRGAKLFVIALLFNLATYLLKFVGMNVFIRFGILNLLSICMLFAAPMSKLIQKIPPLLGVLISAVLFILTMNISNGWLGFGDYRIYLSEGITSLPFLFPLGIVADGFFSADYFPLLPWVFVYFAGMSLGVWAAKGKFPKFMYNQHIRPLSFVGRHTLIIYILHQPVAYAFFLLVDWIVKILP